MDTTTAQRLVRETFKAAFDKSRYRDFINELCNGFDEAKAQPMTVPDAFSPHVRSCQRLGTFRSADGELADVLVVQLTHSDKLDRTRTALRDFVAHKLKRGENYKEAGLVAFVAPDSQSWRFSFVRMEYETRRDPATGKIRPEERLTPARRYSYLVGADEECHTAQSRFVPLLQNTAAKPTLSQLEEAFSVEAVTREFFAQYAELFSTTKTCLDALVKKDALLRAEFVLKAVSTTDFVKKLLGQIVFLYFLQKKGWLGVPRDGVWGEGPRHFMRSLVSRALSEETSFFNDVLEPLFYDTLATDRGNDAWCETLTCRMPFLNDGLFEPLAGYDWETTNITLPNALFSNHVRSAGGDDGTGILDVFDRYNFTVNEAEPLERDVAIDPEMLGKVFENLLEENQRKGLGAFYTPREVVHFMCQESLINYLDNGLHKPDEEPRGSKSKGEPLDVPRKDIEDWIHQSDQFSHYAAAIAAGTKGDHYPRPPESIRKASALIDALLRDITVCDPAIGSGAFPVGMMTEIVRGRVALTPYFPSAKGRAVYDFKRHAIQNCLYGVDIDPGAVEIAKLRLWLSLVVDEDDVKQLRPLPNLDYKIVAGDSLLGVKRDVLNAHLFKRLEELKPQYFNAANRREKSAFKREIDRLIHELTTGQGVFDFEIFFSEVFHKEGGGFDVVVANPPYIGESGNKDLFRKTARGPLGEFYLGKMDYFYFFFHLALNLAAPRGDVAFITTNYYLTATGARYLRADFRRRGLVRKLVNFDELRIFESAQGQHNMVTMLRKGTGDESAHTCITKRTGTADAQALASILRWKDAESRYYEVPQTELYDGPENYIRLNRERIVAGAGSVTINTVLDKVAGQGSALLGRIANIDQGVVSGCDYVSPRNEDKLASSSGVALGDGIFVLDLDHPSDKRVVGTFSDVEKRLLRKFYKNSDISRYACSTRTSKRLLYIGRDLDDLRDYPHVFEHMKKFKAILSDRREVGNGVIKFFQLQWPRSEHIFTGKKVVVPYRSEENSFAFNDTEWFCRSDCYVITQRDTQYLLGYLVALLNSSLYFQWLFHRGKRKGKMLELFQTPLSEIPIKSLTREEQKELSDLAEQIMSARRENPGADTSKLERTVDAKVFDLYKLSAEERGLVLRSPV